MIFLMKFCSYHLKPAAFKKPIQFLNVTSQRVSIKKSYCSEVQDPSIQKIRNIKRYFAIGLFGVTLVIALVVKRRKKKEWADLLSQTKRVGNFGKLTLFEFEHYMLPKPILELMDKIKKFNFREDDVVVSSFPKTGTTWLTEIIWLLTHDLDFETAKSVNISDRFPYLEWPSPGLNSIANSKCDPRLIKTHLPISILFKDQEVKPRVISITRDPKDVVVSFYHFARMNNIIDFEGNFQDFLELFLQDKVAYGPLYRFYHELNEFKKSPEWEGKLLIIKYENLMNNFEKEVEKLCLFLGIEVLNEKKMKKLKEHCSFKEMEVNSSVNFKHWDDLGVRKKGESRFLRKGIVGDWKGHFNPEQKEKFDEWYSRRINILKPVDEEDVKIPVI